MQILSERTITVDFLKRRPRRNKKSFAIRRLIEETVLNPSDFIAPFFVTPGLNKKITSGLPDVDILSADQVLKSAEHLHKEGVMALILFPIIENSLKDSIGSESYNESGLIPETVKLLKKELPSMCVITDIALDPYTSHGHDGILDDNGLVANDPSLEILAKQALTHGEAGADIVAPSDMMDGRIGYIRNKLDKQNLSDVSILSYCAKFASSLYKGFRDTLGSKLVSGDKLSYQLSPSNISESLLEAKLDLEEGADMLLVKPSMFYSDVISKIKNFSDVPVGAYQVSGEYSMIKAAGKLNYLDVDSTLKESLISLKRSGADFIISYATEHLISEKTKFFY